MTNRAKLKNSSIHATDRDTLHQYGFNDAEIDRLRSWVMSNPWSINEVNDAFEKVSNIKKSIDKIKKVLTNLTSSAPAITLELNHLKNQFNDSSKPSLIEGFPYIESSTPPDPSLAEQQLLENLSSLDLALEHYLETIKQPMFIQYHDCLMEVIQTTGKERILSGLRSIWAQKHPEDQHSASQCFLNFVAILFMSTSDNEATILAPENVKSWWNECQKANLKTGKKLKYPVLIMIDEDGNKTYLSSPPETTDK
ncbi:hypothetical protein [Shewanella psychrotolerans]|uniref:hypothetical protein n=1 Tax=Shewanella psychrotolerans TaxID=2864206 RepID=UPI001C65F491|nr:hypothetical protein [Shewanella psychrotolerans]QYK02412.1 hypothetical protein K0I62_05520 [Shewanella psychrotolerans]